MRDGDGDECGRGVRRLSDDDGLFMVWCVLMSKPSVVLACGFMRK